MDTQCHNLLVAVPKLEVTLENVVVKVIIEKSRGGRFLWNRNWDLGRIWAEWFQNLLTYETII